MSLISVHCGQILRRMLLVLTKQNVMTLGNNKSVVFYLSVLAIVDFHFFTVVLESGKLKKLICATSVDSLLHYCDSGKKRER
jgi:hypothetical protein